MQNDNLIVYKNTQIIDCQYFGCINYYNSLFNYSNNKIEIWDNFQKMSFRNRCTILGSNGPIDLTIPVVGGRNKRQLMKDVKIDDSQHWRKQHIKTICSCYGKSAFFEFYRDGVENLIKCQKSFLIDLNWEIIIWMKKLMQISSEISYTEAYQINYENTYIDDNRNVWLPKSFYKTENIVKYSQVFQEKIGFQPNVSILDLLFCEGPNMKNVIKNI